MTHLKPDLSGNYFNVIQEPLKAGEYFDVHYKIKNTGAPYVATSTVKFYLSDNSIISGLAPYDRYLGSATLGSATINPGSKTGTLTKRLRLPGLGDPYWEKIGKGTYTIGMYVDANNSIMESNEGNNKNTGMFKDKDDVFIDPTVKVKVNIDRVRGDLDGWWNDSDFYSRMTIDRSTKTTKKINGDNDIRPNWNHSVETLKRYIPIKIQLWDSDVGDDDHADINHRTGKRDLYLTYDAVTGRISGDLYGLRGKEIYASGGGDSKRAEMWFTVDHT